MTLKDPSTAASALDAAQRTDSGARARVSAILPERLVTQLKIVCGADIIKSASQVVFSCKGMTTITALWSHASALHIAMQCHSPHDA